MPAAMSARSRRSHRERGTAMSDGSAADAVIGFPRWAKIFLFVGAVLVITGISWAAFTAESNSNPPAVTFSGNTTTTR